MCDRTVGNKTFLPVYDIVIAAANCPCSHGEDIRAGFRFRGGKSGKLSLCECGKAPIFQCFVSVPKNGQKPIRFGNEDQAEISIRCLLKTQYISKRNGRRQPSWQQLPRLWEGCSNAAPAGKTASAKRAAVTKRALATAVIQ